MPIRSSVQFVKLPKIVSDIHLRRQLGWRKVLPNSCVLCFSNIQYSSFIMYILYHSEDFCKLANRITTITYQKLSTCVSLYLPLFQGAFSFEFSKRDSFTWKVFLSLPVNRWLFNSSDKNVLIFRLVTKADDILNGILIKLSLPLRPDLHTHFYFVAVPNH